MRAERAPQLHLVTLEFVVEVLEQLTHLSSSPPPPEGCGAAKTAQAGGEEVAYSPPLTVTPLFFRMTKHSVLVLSRTFPMFYATAKFEMCIFQVFVSISQNI
jgi:hypothetical protein